LKKGKAQNIFDNEAENMI